MNRKLREILLGLDSGVVTLKKTEEDIEDLLEAYREQGEWRGEEKVKYEY